MEPGQDIDGDVHPLRRNRLAVAGLQQTLRFSRQIATRVDHGRNMLTNDMKTVP